MLSSSFHGIIPSIVFLYKTIDVTSILIQFILNFCCSVRINDKKEWSLIPYGFATFINHGRKLLDWCDHKLDKENVCEISQKPEAVGAPIFKGKYAYGLIGGNKKIVILANHLDWFDNTIM